MLIQISSLMEQIRVRRSFTRSRIREKLGLSTRRDMIGFEKKGQKKIVPKRKRPKKSTGLLARTIFKAMRR